MVQIFQDYAAFRSLEPLDGEPHKPRSWNQPRLVPKIWKVSSILTSCKLFAALMLPELYREVVLADEATLPRFFCEPSIDSFKLVHTMKITCTEASSHMDIATPIQDRILQSQLLAFPQYNWNLVKLQRETGGGERFNGSSQRSSNYRDFWKESERHTLKTVYIDSENIDALNEIAKLMKLQHVIINGMSYTRFWACECGNLENRDYEALSASKLTINVKSASDPNDDCLAETGIFQRSGDVNLRLGWDLEDDPWYLDKADERICEYLAVLFQHRQHHRIVVSPYIPDGAEGSAKHEWCFPKKIPIIASRHVVRHFYSKVMFASPCDCGFGDQSGFWDGCERKVNDWLESQWRYSWNSQWREEAVLGGYDFDRETGIEAGEPS